MLHFFTKWEKGPTRKKPAHVPQNVHNTSCPFLRSSRVKESAICNCMPKSAPKSYSMYPWGKLYKYLQRK